MKAATNYQLFGLMIRSELALPELFAADNDREADVTVRCARISQSPSNDRLQVRGKALVLTVPGVARYRIEGGREIVVDREPGVPERNIRLYLLGSAFGALLHQRGMLPLHANSIEINGQAVAFMGESGAGKSTLAAWFHDRCYRIIADDVCVVRCDVPGKPQVAPGLPRLRLWADALYASGRDPAQFQKSLRGAKEIDKFDVPLKAQRVVRDPLRLSGLYLLGRGKDFETRTLSGLDAAEAIFAHTYRGSFASTPATRLVHWQAAVTLAQRTPVQLVCRSMQPWKMEVENQKLLTSIEDYMQRLDATS